LLVIRGRASHFQHTAGELFAEASGEFFGMALIGLVPGFAFAALHAAADAFEEFGDAFCDRAVHGAFGAKPLLDAVHWRRIVAGVTENVSAYLW
jgi:hypothetical protein